MTRVNDQRDYVITRATVQDIPEIVHVVRSAYLKYVDRIGKEPAPMLADYADLLQTHDVFVLRASGQDNILGSVVLNPDDDGRTLKVNNLVVDPATQGRQYGTALMNYAEEVAREQGRKTLALFTNLKMHENFGFYTKLGFVETETRTEDGYERRFYSKELM